MGARRIDDLDNIQSGEEPKRAARDAEPPRPKAQAPEAMVDVNYPEPTSLSRILRDVAKWSGQSFVMEPLADVKLQIFAAGKMSRAHAYELFLASLSVVNLRAVQVGVVVKIVPSGLPVSA